MSTKTIVHPVASKLATPETFYQASTGLYFLVFQTLPTTDELAAYARFRCNAARDAQKAVKGRKTANKQQREHFLKMAERWAGLAMAPSPRIDSMREAASRGEAMKVYF